MNQAAIYTRYSSDKQNETSSQAQIRAAETYCASKNYTIVKVYTDEAKSAKTDDRPAFQQMIVDANLKRFNILIVHKINRFSCNRYDSAIYKRALQKANVTSKINSHVVNDKAIIVENAIPVIVNKLLFEQVKTIMKKNKQRPGSFRAKEIYLLSGKIFCGECNAAMIGKASTVRQAYRYSRYVCGSQDRHLGTCHNSIVQRDEIEKHVADRASSNNAIAIFK